MHAGTRRNAPQWPEIFNISLLISLLSGNAGAAPSSDATPDPVDAPIAFRSFPRRYTAAATSSWSCLGRGIVRHNPDRRPHSALVGHGPGTGGPELCMRSIFAIWSDNGRVDYGITRPRLTGTMKLGIAIATFAAVIMVGGKGIRNVFSDIVASYNSDSTNQDLAESNRDVVTAPRAITAGQRQARSAKPRAQLQTIGLAPIGAPDRSAIAEAAPFAGSAANPVIASADQAQVAGPGDRGAAKLEENKNKPEEKSRVAKKKRTPRASVAQVYQLPDGRQVVVRGRVGTADFGAWGNNFDRRVHMARPWFFGSPF